MDEIAEDDIVEEVWDAGWVPKKIPHPTLHPGKLHRGESRWRNSQKVA